MKILGRYVTKSEPSIRSLRKEIGTTAIVFEPNGRKYSSRFV